MAVVGTAYVHIKALANDMAKDIEQSLQPLAQKMQSAGQEAGKNFSENFNNSLEDSEKNSDFNPAEGLSERVKPELEEMKKEFRKAEEEVVRQNKTNLDRIAENFKNTGRRSSNNFIQNFGMGMWFQLIHRLYDMFLFVTPAIGVAGGAIMQLVGGLYAMVGAMGPAVNLAGVMPGLYYTLAGSIVAVNIGLKDSVESAGLGFQAMKAIATGADDADKKMKKYQESLKGLGPEARKFTETLVGMSGQFMDISSNIQSALLPNLTKALEKLQSNGIIDAFGRSFEGLALQAGRTALKMAELSDSEVFRGRLATVFDSTNAAAGMLGNALVNVVEALVNVAAAAAPLTEAFAKWIETVTGNWATESSQNFQGMQDAMYRGRDAIKVLWSVVTNLWGTLKGLGKAGYDAGMDLWKAFDGVTGKWNDFVNSVEGQKALKDFFADAARGTKAVGNAFRELGKAMVEWSRSEVVLQALEGLGPMIDQLGDMILRMVEEAGPALGEMLDSVLNLLDTLTEGQGVSAFAGVIKVFADALNGLLSLPGGHHILIFFATLVGIFKASSIVAQVTGFRGALSGLMKTASNISKSGDMKTWVRGFKMGTDEAGNSVKKFNSGFFGGMARVRDAGRTTSTSVRKNFSNLGKSIANTKIGGSMKTVASKLNPAPLIAKTRSIGSSAGRSMAQGMSTAGSAMKSGLRRDFTETGRFSALGFKQGLNAAKASVVTNARNLGKGVSKAAKAVLGIKSPSTVFMAIGRDVGRGFQNGIKSSQAQVSTAARRMGTAAATATRGTVTKGMAGVGTAATAPLVTGMNKAGGAVKRGAGGIGKSLKGLGRGFSAFLGGPIGIIFTLVEVFMTAYMMSDTFRNAVNGAFKSIGDALKPLLPLVTGIWDQISSVFTGLLEKIGPPLMGAFSDIVSAIGPVLAGILPTISNVLGTLGTVLGGIATSMGPVLSTVGSTIANIFTQLGPTIGDLVRQIGPLAQALLPMLGQAFGAIAKAVGPLISTIGGLVATVLPPLVNLISAVLPVVFSSLLPVIQTVIGAIVPIINSIVQVLTGVVTFLTGVFTGNWSMAWEGIKGIFTGIWNLLVSVVTGAVQIIWSVVQSWINLLRGVIVAGWTGIATFFTGLWEGIKTVFSNALNFIVNWVMSKWNQMRANTLQVFTLIRATISNVMNGIRNFISGVLSTIVGFFTNRWNYARALTLNSFNQIRAAISNAINAARNIVSSVTSRIVGTIQGAWSRVRGATSGAWNSFKSIVSNGVNGAMSVVRSIPGRVSSALSGMASRLRSVGSNMINGLIGGIKSKAGEVARQAKKVVSDAINAAKRALKIQSPSRVFMEIGAYTGEGLAIGIENTGSRVASASQSMADSVTKAFQDSNVVSSVGNSAQQAIAEGNEALRRSIADREGIASSLQTAQQNLSLASAFESADVSMFGVGADTIRSLADGMRSQEETLRLQSQRTANIISTTLSSSMKSTQSMVSLGTQGALGNILNQAIPTDLRTSAQPLQVMPGISATMSMNNSDFNPVLTPQNQALVKALSEYVGTSNTNYFNIQKDRSIKELAVEISREMERTK